MLNQWFRLITVTFHTDRRLISHGSSPLPRHSSDTSLDLHQLLSTLARFDSISNDAKSAACTASKMVGFPSLYLPISSLWKSIRNQLKLGFVLQLDRFNDLSTRSSNSPIQVCTVKAFVSVIATRDLRSGVPLSGVAESLRLVHVESRKSHSVLFGLYYDTDNLPKVLHCMLLPDGCGSGPFCPSAVMVSKAVTWMLYLRDHFWNVFLT
ncbi:hypothetical protein LXL04_028413 [Taraxacum kok-saghyz]